MANGKVGILRWEEPPSASQRRGKARFNVESVFHELQRNPGHSALIADEVSQSYAGQSPLIKRLKELGVHVTATKVGSETGKHRVYARVDGKRGPGRPRKLESIAS